MTFFEKLISLFSIDTRKKTSPKNKSITNTGYSQIDHIVVSEYGIFVIETKNYTGKIKGGKRDREWSVNYKFKMYNPLRKNYGHIQALKNVLRDYKSLKFISIISFTKRCELYIDQELRDLNSDEFVIYDIKLTDCIQRKLFLLKKGTPEPVLDEADISNIIEILTHANITDPVIRKQHNSK